MTIRSGVRVQVRGERRRIHLALAVVLIGGLLAALLISQRLRGLLLATLNAAELRMVLICGGSALLLLIPIAGIVSLVSQYAFWEGWLAGFPDVECLRAESEVTAADSVAAEAETPPREAANGASTQLFVVYLDGIHQCESDHPGPISAFLTELEQQLPQGTQLLRGLDTYTVMPVALAEDRGGSWFWRRLFALQEQHPSGLVLLLASVLVQANNVIKVGISSDRRYGPIRHYQLALKIGLRLREHGFRTAASSELVLLGYSGGGEMAFGVADYLSRMVQVPLHIISFCGVFSGDHALERVASISTVVGDRDPVAAFSNIAYPGRTPLLPFSRWRRALAAGRVQRRCIRGMSHNGAHGPFSNRYRQAVVDAVLDLLPVLPGCAPAAAQE
jgi:hypothetical protein